MDKEHTLNVLLEGYRAFKRVCEGKSFTEEGVRIAPRLGSWGQYTANQCTTCIAGAYRWERAKEFILNKAQDLSNRTSMQPGRALQQVLRDEELILDAFRFPSYEDSRKDRIIRLMDGRTPLEALKSVGIYLPIWDGKDKYELTEQEALERLRVILTHEGRLRSEPTEETVSKLLLTSGPLDLMVLERELEEVMPTSRISHQTQTNTINHGTGVSDLMNQLI